jgi:hypothetical protein
MAILNIMTIIARLRKFAGGPIIGAILIEIFCEPLSEYAQIRMVLNEMEPYIYKSILKVVAMQINNQKPLFDRWLKKPTTKLEFFQIPQSDTEFKMEVKNDRILFVIC